MKFKVIVLAFLLSIAHAHAIVNRETNRETAEMLVALKELPEVLKKAAQLNDGEQLSEITASVAESTATEKALDALASVSISVGFLKAFSDSFAKDGDMEAAASAAVAYILKKTLREEQMDDKAVLPEPSETSTSNK